MCLMLYIGAHKALPRREDPDLTVGPLNEVQQLVSQWFAQPYVQLVGAHTGCSCGFPSVVADRVIEFFDGMWDDQDERKDDLRSIGALLQLLGAALEAGEPVELFPVWEGNEARPPKGIIHWSLRELKPEQVFFNEHYLYAIRS